MDTHEDFLGRIRYPGYHDRIMSAEKAAEFIKPEMTLGVSGFTIAGYPKAVAGELAKRARNGEKLELTVYSGASLGEEFDGELARAGALKARMPYQTNKDLRNSINADPSSDEIWSCAAVNLSSRQQFTFSGSGTL